MHATNIAALNRKQAAPGAHCRPFTFFSTHAKLRLAERTQLSCERAIAMLDAGQCVNTGRDPGLNREHLVFFSAADNECFVAVRDYHSGKVITILTLEYQANCSWPIKATDQEAARELALTGHLTDAATAHNAAPPQEASAVAALEPTTFTIKAFYMDAMGRQKCTTLGKTDARQFNFDVRAYVHAANLEEEFKALALRKVLDPKCIFSLRVSLGRQAPVIINIESAQALFNAHWAPGLDAA